MVKNEVLKDSIIDVEYSGVAYTMYCTLESFKVYTAVTGRYLLTDIEEALNGNEDVIYGLICATLRKDGKIVGKDIEKIKGYNAVALLIELRGLAIQTLINSLPTNNGDEEKKTTTQTI